MCDDMQAKPLGLLVLPEDGFGERLSKSLASRPVIQPQASSVLSVPPCRCFGILVRCFTAPASLAEKLLARGLDLAGRLVADAHVMSARVRISVGSAGRDGIQHPEQQTQLILKETRLVQPDKTVRAAAHLI